MRSRREARANTTTIARKMSEGVKSGERSEMTATATATADVTMTMIANGGRTRTVEETRMTTTTAIAAETNEEIELETTNTKASAGARSEENVVVAPTTERINAVIGTAAEVGTRSGKATGKTVVGVAILTIAGNGGEIGSMRMMGGMRRRGIGMISTTSNSY
jgi:hypothetical protein